MKKLNKREREIIIEKIYSELSNKYNLEFQKITEKYKKTAEYRTFKHKLDNTWKVLNEFYTFLSIRVPRYKRNDAEREFPEKGYLKQLVDSYIERTKIKIQKMPSYKELEYDLIFLDSKDSIEEIIKKIIQKYEQIKYKDQNFKIFLDFSVYFRSTNYDYRRIMYSISH